MCGMRAALVNVCVFAALSAFAEKQPFSRYESILERQMFGPLPPGFDPAKMPGEVVKTKPKELTKEQEMLKSAVHFSVMNVAPSGEIEVGFSDLSDKESPMHYFLKVGESQNGWKVENADKDSATVTLSKGDIVLDLVLGDNSAKGGGVAKAAAGGQRGASSLLNGGTARQRRQAELDAQRAQYEQRLKAERAEMAQQLKAQKEQAEKDREEFKASLKNALAEVKSKIEAERKAEAKDGDGQSGQDEPGEGNGSDNED